MKSKTKQAMQAELVSARSGASRWARGWHATAQGVELHMLKNGRNSRD
jgi:hypothetical protein